MRSAVIPALLLAVCGSVHAEDPSPAPFVRTGIGVYFSFEQTPSKITTSAMRAELASIMKPLGLSFVWKELNGETAATFPDLIVIRFKGSCEGIVTPSREPSAVPNDTTLAATRTSGGQVLHFTEVHCDAVRHYLAADVVSLNEPERNSIYGRALGRIIAHEMYHVFGDTEKHGAAGIARPSYSRQDLLKPSFGFEPKEAQAMRTYASHTLQPGGPDVETDEFADSAGRDSTAANSVSDR